MKNSLEFDIGEFLFRFYRKHTTSFLANIYKAGITGSSKDIHRARLDAKKVLAILDLLRIVQSEKIIGPEFGRFIKKLYQVSGKIREIQVNMMLLSRPEYAVVDLILFKIELLTQEKERTREFLQAIRKFKEKKLIKAETTIKKAIYEITPMLMQKKINRYIRTKMRLINTLFEKGHDNQNLHKIRQHLKELAAVLTLVVSVKSTRKVEQAIDGLNKTEMMIGDWHDKEVLADSIEIYLEEATDITESQRVPVRDFHHQLIESNRTQIESIIQDVRTILMEGIPLKARGS
jgi:CHAD domain-containing protein